MIAERLLRLYRVTALCVASLFGLWGVAHLDGVLADNAEILIRFQALDASTGKAMESVNFHVESAKYGGIQRRHGQFTSAEDGDALTIRVAAPEGWIVYRWAGDARGTGLSIEQAFTHDATVQVWLRSDEDSDEEETDTGEWDDAGDGTSLFIDILATADFASARKAPPTRTTKSVPTEIWVDFNHVGIETGDESTPFNTVPEGVSRATSYAIDTVKIQPGATTETMTISTAIILTAPNGTVRIGSSAFTPTYTLSTAVSGSGTVSGAGDYIDGDTVAVSASASASWAFSHWSGDLEGTSSVDSVLMDDDKSVTAVFVLDPAELDVTAATLSNDDPIPDEAEAGDALAIKWSVINGGDTADAADNDWTNNVFLSRDAAYDDEDRAIGTPATVSEAESYTASTSVTIPDVSPGDYYILVQPDVGEEVTHTASGRDTITLSHAITIYDSELTQ